MTIELIKSYFADIWADLIHWEKQRPDHIGAWIAVLGVILFLSSKLLGWIGIAMVMFAVGYMIYRLAKAPK